jgi:hypothetical protein
MYGKGTSVILTRRNAIGLFLITVAALFAVEAWAATLIPAVPDKAAAIAVAITADVALGVPLLYYVLLAHKNYMPTGGVVGLYFLALGTVRLILPASQQGHLDFVNLLAPVGELAALGWLGVKAGRILHHVQAMRRSEIYLADALREAVQRALGQSLVASLLATELALIYFAFAGWFQRFRTDQRATAFSYHRHNGYVALIATVIFLLLVEGTALHVIIRIWSPTAAWVMTALHIYTLFWIVGFYHAVRLQPIVLTPTHLYLRTGFLWRADIPLANIAAVDKPTAGGAQADSYLNASIAGDPRLVLHLHAPVVVAGLFGRSRSASTIGISVDDESRLLGELNRRLP